MLISPQMARETLADLAQDCSLPLDLGELIPGKAEFLDHGHVLIGDVAVRGYKDKGRWKYDARDIRRAGQTLAALTVDHTDVVEAQVPSPRYFEDRASFEDWNRADWRRTLNAWIYAAARRSRRHDISDAFDDFDSDVWSSRYAIGAHGLPGQLTFEELVSFYGERAVAGTRPLDLLTRSGTHWVLPRAYVDLLDRWQERDRVLTEQARICTGCQCRGDRRAWRTTTASGYVTLCPACSGDAFQAYKGHLNGVAYSSLRRTQRADEYLCCLCRASRASIWDHCHDHGYVRGPVCASCNTFEGNGVDFLRRDGSVQHLLECRGCRERRTLPRRFHLDVVLDQLEEVERHGHCRRRPHAYREGYADGVHRINLSCHAHASTSRWTKEMTAAEVTDVVRAFVGSTLSGAAS
ncbi:endonuclease domain-containing protein [Streptomyces sp. NPDC002758]